LHEWQLLHGKPSRCARFHNKEFRAKARGFGVTFDDHGRLKHVEPGPFTALLEAHGVDKSGLGALRRRAKRSSRLAQPTCACSVAWMSGDLSARCERCGQLYEPAGKADG
jgi:hypothetical protein